MHAKINLLAGAPVTDKQVLRLERVRAPPVPAHWVDRLTVATAEASLIASTLLYGLTRCRPGVWFCHIVQREATQREDRTSVEQITA